MDKYSTKDFDRDFPDDDACIDWLFNARWPEGVTCPNCQVVTSHYKLANRPAYSCEKCGHHTYPMAGSIFERSTTPLRIWFKAIAYMAATRCGISSRALSRDLGVGVKTSWRMITLIRRILVDGETDLLLGHVETDETYIGGRQRGGKRGRGSENKTVVFGMVERGGRVRAKVVRNVRAATLLPEIQANILPDATVYTDDLLSYGRLTKLGFSHKSVAHSQGQYVVGNDIHTNTIEGFWSQLKRSIDGTYHHVTTGYLQGYVDEYSWRYSHRHDQQAMFLTMLGQVVRHAA